MEAILKSNQYEYDSETGEVTFDLDVIENKIQRYAEIYLSMMPNDECEGCEDCYDQVELSGFPDEELILHLEESGYKVGRGDFYYPHNSIRIKSAFDELLDNIDNIPIEEIEKLNEKYK